MAPAECVAGWGAPLSFRNKLLTVFTITVFVSVTAVAWIVSALARHAFEKTNEDRTQALVAQFRHEFNRRGQEVAQRIAAIASSESATRIAIASGRGSPDYGAYLNEARNVADNQQLDFLELVDTQGTIISSAQWPAKFGYKESLTLDSAPKEAFLKREDLPDGAALGLFAVSKTPLEEEPLFVIGGRKLDKNFLASLELPAGMRALFYQNLENGFSSQFLIGGSVSQKTDQLIPLIEKVRQQPREVAAIIHWSASPEDDEAVEAIPLIGLDQRLLGVLLIGDSRRPYVELRRQIRSAALWSGGVGVQQTRKDYSNLLGQSEWQDAIG